MTRPADKLSLDVYKEHWEAKTIGRSPNYAANNFQKQLEEKVQMRVSSKHLSLASPYWRVALSEVWCGPRQPGKVMVYEIQKFDLDAMVTLMNVIHGYGQKVPRTVSIEELVRFVILMDYFLCAEICSLYTEIWTERIMYGNEKDELSLKDNLKALWAFRLLEHEEGAEFFKQRSVRTMNERPCSPFLPGSEDLIEEIDSTRVKITRRLVLKLLASVRKNRRCEFCYHDPLERFCKYLWSWKIYDAKREKVLFTCSIRIWAREEHAPAIEAAKNIVLKAVFSRSLKSAQSIADAVTTPVELYSDESGEGFDGLLKRADIQAIVVSLPIANQPPYIKSALLAGKHVLSEKPVAENVKEAEELIQWYRSEVKGPTWAIAENWRFLASYKFAAEQIKTLGKITGFQGRHHSCVPLNWKFNLTEWRRNPTHQGGYILDGGVHHMAGLRLLLGSQPGNEIARVSAFTSQIQEYLPPVDTADVILRTKSGITGVYQISRGTTLRANEWTIACEKGWIQIQVDKVTISRDGQEEVRTVPNERTGVPPEIRAWGESLVSGTVRPEQEPEAALADLELIELMLRSGEQQGTPLSCKHQVA
ncbi:hypothetical protein PISL3812_06512 [Talaromyces islandicus]|uniref:Uncharacterized protein n=1 Tax=Talaromyces islandicus TaxID=28573 RepID=A0A0U1M364_TALIS|nr:hypothetical protein PISL3812_06512 [Talaromyces islandicus]